MYIITIIWDLALKRQETSDRNHHRAELQSRDHAWQAYFKFSSGFQFNQGGLLVTWIPLCDI